MRSDPPFVGNLYTIPTRRERRRTERRLTTLAPAAISRDTVNSSAIDRCAVYRLWNSFNVLLYVGIVDNPRKRWEQHASEKEWWRDVRQKSVTWYESRTEAAARELDAILTEEPIYNKAGAPELGPVQDPKDSAAEIIEHLRGTKITLGFLAGLHDMSARLNSIRVFDGARYPISPETHRRVYEWAHGNASPNRAKAHMWLVDNIYNEKIHKIVMADFAEDDAEERAVRMAQVIAGYEATKAAPAKAAKKNSTRRSRQKTASA